MSTSTPSPWLDAKTTLTRKSGMMISACSVARRRCWEGIAAMATPDLTVTRGEVSVVEIHRPPNNYLDHSLVRELADALQALAASDTRAVV